MSSNNTIHKVEFKPVVSQAVKAEFTGYVEKYYADNYTD